MSYTVKDLQNLLSANPDIAVIPDRIDERNLLLSDFAAQHGGYVPVDNIPLASEYEIQKAVFDECDRRAIERPEWGLVAAIPNGQYRRGQRMEAGLRQGLPDLQIFAARHGKHGCFIEIKKTPNKQTQEQLMWQRRLRVEDYICECIWDKPAEVLSLIEWYLFA